MTSAQQRVGQAVHLAVAKILATKTDVRDRHALAQSIGRRLQGTYGAELRRQADANPNLSADDLVAVVMGPTEFASDDELARIRESHVLGARDRTRRTWISDMDEPPPIDPNISERVAALRALIPDDPPTFTPPEPFVVDREHLRVVPPEVYAAAEEGRRMFGENRKARLANDRIANEGAK